MFETTSKCPAREITPLTDFLMRLYKHYAAGFLFQSGGISEQPALYFEAMNFIDNEVHRG